MTVNDREWKFLAEQTGLQMPFNDLYFRYLRGLGYTGTLQDMIAAYGYGLTPSKGGIVYDPDAQSYFDRLPNEVTSEYKSAINDLIVSGKEDGWWAKTDVLTFFGAVGGIDNGLENIRQDLYHGTAFNNPTYTEGVGIQGNGTSSYIGSGFNPFTAVGANFIQNSANFGIWSLTAGMGSVSDAGYYDGADGITIQMRDATNNATGRINQASVLANTGVTDGRGFLEVDRSAASGDGSCVMRRNGTTVVTNTTNVSSTEVVNAAIQYLRYGTGSYSSRQLAIGVIGGHLTNTEALARYQAFLTFLQAVGTVT